MNREDLLKSLALKDFTLNDVLYNLKMQRRGESEYVSIPLLNDDLEYLMNWISDLEKAYEKKEAITLSSVVNGRYVTNIIEPDLESYDYDYMTQLRLLHGIKRISQQLIDGEIKSKIEEEKISQEVDSIMDEIYTKTGIENPNKKESKDTEELENEIMDEIYKKIDEDNKKASALEVILNEAKDVISDMNDFISSHDDYLEYDLDEIALWSRNSVSVFEKLKTDLENDYKSGNKLSLASLKSDGSYEVKMVDNEEVYFNRQMTLFNNMIEASKELEGKITKSIKKEVSEQTSNKQDKKCVIFRIGNDVCVVSNDMEISDVQSLNSDILRDAGINDSSVKLYVCPNKGVYSVRGVIINMGEDGVMTIDGSLDEIEFHNHPENYRIYNVSDLNILDKVLSFVKEDKIDEIQNLIKENGAEEIWNEVSNRIENNSMKVEDFHDLVDYLLEKYDSKDIIKDKVFLNDAYKQLISKYPIDEDDLEEDKTTELLNSEVVLDQLLELTKNGDQDKIAQIIKLCRPNDVWKELMKRLDEKTMDVESYRRFVSVFAALLSPQDRKYFLNCDAFKELLKKYPMKESSKEKDDSTDEKDTDEKDTGKIKPVEPDKSLKKHVKSRREKKSLVQRFKELKKWQKVAIVAGAITCGALLIGVGVYHLVPGAAAAIDSFISGKSATNPGQTGIGLSDKIHGLFNQANEVLHNNVAANPEVVSSATQTITTPEIVSSAAQTASEVVDYSAIGEGHKVFADAFSAVNGANPLSANEWFSNNPVGVFNTVTNEFLNVTPEQLHDVEFLKQLANDPNNAMLFGNSLSDASGYIPLTDLVGEVIKGGKVL